MQILGAEITLARVKSVSGITVASSGEVTALSGDPHELLQNLINQFIDLSGEVVKKTMESVLSNYAVLSQSPIGLSDHTIKKAEAIGTVTTSGDLTPTQIQELNKVLEGMSIAKV